MIAVLAAACLSTNTLTANDAQWWRWRRPKTSLVTHTFTAATGSPTDVQAAITNAGAGDTVVIPAGTWDWTDCNTATACVDVTKAITIRGAGCALDASHRPTSCQTVIRDAPTANASYRLFRFTLPAGTTTIARLSQLEIVNNGRTALSIAGVISVIGTINDDGRRFVLDHLKMTLLNVVPYLDIYSAYGVVYHSVMSYTSGRRLASIHGNTAATDFGDTPWSADTNLGTDKYSYFEDNELDGDVTSERAHIDAFSGARYVARFNAASGWNFGGHGTESSGRYRSTRDIEVYGNTHVAGSGGGQTAGQNRGGISLFFNNTYTGYGAASIQFNCDRSIYTENAWPIDSSGQTWLLGPPWGHADGTNIWDVNDAGNPFYTGTVSTWTLATKTITVSPDPGWTTNQWLGYILRRTTSQTQPLAIIAVTPGNPTVFQTSGSHGLTTGDSIYIAGITTSPALTAGTQWSLTVVDADEFSIPFTTSSVSDAVGKTTIETASDVSANTSNSLTLQSALSGTSFSFRTGEAFTLNKVTQCLDGPGRAKGSSFGGALAPITWGSNDQVTEGAYNWSNRTDGALVGISGQVGANYHTRPNVHVYNEAHASNPDCSSAFNGTCGVGVGLLSARPATCTTGVAYWATDQGSWNATGADGVLFKCTLMNTWTSYYTPYAYPHPIRNDNVVSQ